MKKARILFISPLPPPVHGAAMVSRQIKESRLVNETFDCDFVNISTSRHLKEIRKSGPVLGLKKALRFTSAFFLTVFKLVFRRPDLCCLAITCHGISFLKDAPFVLLCKLAGCKVVIHQHNKGMSAYVDRPLYRFLLPLVYRNTKVMLLSERLYPDIERVVDREQLLICHNGIPALDNIPYKEQNVRKELSPGQETEAAHILFLSNLIESKGVFVLLDALTILKDRGFSFICDFVGAESKEIDAETFVREVKKRSLEGMAVYHGSRYGSAKQEFFRKAAIFAFPTYEDCFPLVILEAMQYSLPVISTIEGGIPDMVKDGENGITVRPKDVQGLASAMAKLLDDKSLAKEMGHRARAIYEDLFTEEKFENNFIECLKKAMTHTLLRLKNLPLLHSRSDLHDLPEGKLLINTINAHSYNVAQEDAEFARALLASDVLLPDGAGVVKACRWIKASHAPAERCAGWDLFVHEMGKLRPGDKVMFFGSSEKVLALIREKAAKDYPGVEVLTFSPPFKSEFSEEDNTLMVKAINDADPDLLWIGMTAPKQEKWAHAHWNELDIHCHCGSIGAVFDFYAGTVKRAPLWWQEHSLEWLYRLLKEPRRMFRRYAFGNVKFIWNLLRYEN